MAANRQTNLTSSNSREQCKYFAHGLCKFGDSCFYSHDEKSAKSISICRYYLAGACSFGDRCLYDHVPPKPQSISTSAGSNLNSADSDSSNSASTSPSTNSTISMESNPLVHRFTEFKPRLKTSMSTDKGGVITNSENWSENKSPNSFYEAVTGDDNKNYDYQEINNLNPFDENFTTYLNNKRTDPNANKLLCPYYEKSLSCPYNQSCDFVHGNVCEICNMACLNPSDETQCEQHKAECMLNMEKEMEEAFAVQRSSEKNCGICMEVVWEKEKDADKRFGILENCNHVFCLPCIRKWRSSKTYENKVVKACPECRVKSDFVTPNKFWFENDEDKKKIIQDYKDRLGKTACKYFKQGDGQCPFGSKCFYLHQNRDGTLASLPEPQRRHRINRSGYVESFSNVVTVDFDFSDDEDDDFDILEFFRHSLLWENETSDSDISDLFELSNEVLI